MSSRINRLVFWNSHESSASTDVHFFGGLAGLGPMRISMKRHSYDIYDSDVMKAAVSKLQTSVTTLETSQGVWCCQGGEAGDVLSYGRKQLVTPEVAEAKTWTGMEEQTANNPTTYK